MTELQEKPLTVREQRIVENFLLTELLNDPNKVCLLCQSSLAIRLHHLNMLVSTTQAPLEQFRTHRIDFEAISFTLYNLIDDIFGLLAAAPNWVCLNDFLNVIVLMCMIGLAHHVIRCLVLRNLQMKSPTRDGLRFTNLV